MRKTPPVMIIISNVSDPAVALLLYHHIAGNGTFPELNYLKNKEFADDKMDCHNSVDGCDVRSDMETGSESDDNLSCDNDIAGGDVNSITSAAQSTFVPALSSLDELLEITKES